MRRALLAFGILFCILLCSPGIMASTSWDPNMGGGGSGGGTGTAGNKWTSGWDGFRVTFISNNSSHTAATISVDLTNYDFSGYNVRNFQASNSGKYKFYFSSGGGLSFSTNYRCFNPSTPLPNVIGSKGDIGAVVARFSDAGTIRGIVQKFIYTQNTYGFSTWQDLYNHLSDGTYSGNTFIPNYKILVEPIAYFYYDYDLYAMTAAEAARFQQVYGGLAEKMGSLTRYLLPTAMYLNATDAQIGLSAYPGMSSIVSNSNYRFAVADVLAYGVGCGIVTPLSSWNTNVDLTSSASANSDTYIAGETVTVTATVTNQGTRVAPVSTTSLKERYGKWDGSDAIAVQREATNSLPANGGNQRITYTFIAPAVTASTQFQLAITADSYDEVQESNENNNISYVTISVLPSGQTNQPDLTVTQLDFDKSVYNGGEDATVTVTVKNLGGASASFFYDSLRDMPSKVYYLDMLYVDRLAPGASVTHTFTVTMPLVSARTTIPFGAHADSTDRVTEMREDNNYLERTITVNPVPILPDLKIRSMRTTKTKDYYGGENATIEVSFINAGVVDTPTGFKIRLRDVDGRFFDESKARAKALNSGDAVAVSYTVPLPMVDTPTAITFEAFVDSTEVVAESNETNNKFLFTLIVNPSSPDLVVTSFTTDKAVYSPGETVTAKMTVKNQGIGYAWSFYSRFYDFNAVPSKYVSIQTSSPRTLSQGASATYTMTFEAPLVTENTLIYLRAFADSTEVVAESDETNNLEDCTIFIKPNHPDLDIDVEEGRYYTDTTVITPAEIASSMDILPGEGGNVVFSYYGEGELYEEILLEDVICPEEERQLVWSKWKTPSAPQEMTLKVRWEAKGGSVEKEVPITIVDLAEETPPDTTAKDKKPAVFQPVLPNEASKVTNSWSVWEYEGGGAATFGVRFYAEGALIASADDLTVDAEGFADGRSFRTVLDALKAAVAANIVDSYTVDSAHENYLGTMINGSVGYDLQQYEDYTVGWQYRVYRDIDNDGASELLDRTLPFPIGEGFFWQGNKDSKLQNGDIVVFLFDDFTSTFPDEI